MGIAGWLPNQEPRAGPGDCDVDQLPHHAPVIGEMDERVAAGATAPAASCLIVNQDFDPVTQASGVSFRAELLLQLLQRLMTALLLLVGNVVLPASREGAGTR